MSNHRWILAVSAAVLFPALILHSTCIAVMGPGTWGSGVEEALPAFQEPDASVKRYLQEFQSGSETDDRADEPAATRSVPGIHGRITWTQMQGDRAIYLTEEKPGGPVRQRMYVQEAGKLSEARIPSDHVVVRPKWAGNRIIYERWIPWAVPAAQKLRRYVASWIDPSLRPEAALYGDVDGLDDWRFLMPGHSLAVAPDGRQAALLRSGALLAGYFSVHTWQVGDEQAPVVVSLREHDGKSTRSFSLEWSNDSAALRIVGRTGGFERRASQQGDPAGIPVDLLYLVAERKLYNLISKG